MFPDDASITRVGAGLIAASLPKPQWFWTHQPLFSVPTLPFAVTGFEIVPG